jgi:hypothetical protein
MFFVKLWPDFQVFIRAGEKSFEITASTYPPAKLAGEHSWYPPSPTVGNAGPFPASYVPGSSVK